MVSFLRFKGNTVVWDMEKKRITVFQNLNEPYEYQLADGLKDTPGERYVKFFRM
ncbi:hypothetical protein GCM10027299_35530 [Larkinella ripae]